MNFNAAAYQKNIKWLQEEIDKILPYYSQLKHFSIIEFNQLPEYVQLAITEKKEELKKRLEQLHKEVAKYENYLTL